MYSKEMYSTHNEGKSVVAKWFIRILKNKYKSIHKHMTLISKMVYNNELEDYKYGVNYTVFHRFCIDEFTLRRIDSKVVSHPVYKPLCLTPINHRFRVLT